MFYIATTYECVECHNNFEEYFILQMKPCNHFNHTYFLSIKYSNAWKGENASEYVYDAINARL